MGNMINWDELSGKYWKPTPDKEYIVMFTNWRVDLTDYGEAGRTPRKVLVLDVKSVSCDGKLQEFLEPKEFSTANHTFIDGVKDIIDRANATGQAAIFVQLKKNSKRVYSVFSWQPNPQIMQAFGGVKMQ